MPIFEGPNPSGGGMPQISIEQILELLRTPPVPGQNPVRAEQPQIPPVQGAGPQGPTPPLPSANPMRAEQPQIPPVQGAGPAPNLPVLELLAASGGTPPLPGQNPVRAEQPQVPPVVDGGPQAPPANLPDLSLLPTGQPQGLGSSGNVQNMGESATAQTGQGLIDFIRNNVPQADPISILTSDFAQQFNPATPLPESSIFQPGQDSMSALPGDTIADMVSRVGGAAPGSPVPEGPLPQLSTLGSPDAAPGSRSPAAVTGSSAEGEAAPSAGADDGSGAVSPEIRQRADRIKAALSGRSQAQNDALRQFAISLLQPIFEGQEFALLGNALQNAQGTFEGTREQQVAQAQQQVENQLAAQDRELKAAETASDIQLNQARAQYYRAGGSRGSGRTNDIDAMLDQFNIQSPAGRAFLRERFSDAFDPDPTVLEQPSGQETLNNLVEEARQIDQQAQQSAAGPAGAEAQANAQQQELRSLASQGMVRNDLIDEASVARAASDPSAEQVLLQATANNPEEQARLKERINAYRAGGATSTATGTAQ